MLCVHKSSTVTIWTFLAMFERCDGVWISRKKCRSSWCLMCLSCSCSHKAQTILSIWFYIIFSGFCFCDLCSDDANTSIFYVTPAQDFLHNQLFLNSFCYLIQGVDTIRLLRKYPLNLLPVVSKWTYPKKYLH